MRSNAISFSLLFSVASCLPLAAGTKAGTVTKYFTNFGKNTVTVILETSVTENGQTKVKNTLEKDLAPGARNIAMTIPGQELYQIEFTLVSKQHPDKTFHMGQGINRNNYFAIDDDMMVDMQKDPFS